MDIISPFGKFEENRPKRPGMGSIMGKVLIIFALILMMLIPLSQISGLLSERQTNKERVQQNLENSGIAEQQLLGPILVIPYKQTTTESVDGKAKSMLLQKKAYLLPQQYSVHSTLTPAVLHRGIYDSIMYSSHLLVDGSFDLQELKTLKIAPENILWKNASLMLGISKLQGVEQQPSLIWQSKSVELLSGTNEPDFKTPGLSAPVSLEAKQTGARFHLELNLKGGQTFSIVPVGKQNTLDMNASWASPSFMGETLPSTRDITPKGFSATWRIPYFVRDYGQVFTEVSGIQDAMFSSAVGVKLLTSVDSYRQTERAIKYGILFLLLTFSTYFLFEIIGKQRLHPFQYLLIGLAISLFYLILLALSEVLQFGWAYLSASTAIVSLITLYSRGILGHIHTWGQYLIGGLLSALYTYLYILLQLEDRSLQFGALGLFIVLAAVMYVTRKINWYTEQPA
jgi:inner membrane protein